MKFSIKVVSTLAVASVLAFSSSSIIIEGDVENIPVASQVYGVNSYSLIHKAGLRLSADLSKEKGNSVNEVTQSSSLQPQEKITQISPTPKSPFIDNTSKQSSVAKNTDTKKIIVTAAKRPSLSRPPRTAAPKPITVAPVRAPVQVSPEVKPAPPANTASSKLVLGYGTYYYSGDTSSYNSLTAYSSLINELATHTYSFNSSGGLIIPDGSFPSSQVTYANNNGIKTLAAVRNEEGSKFSASLASSILNNDNNRITLISNIINVLEKYNYKGVNIDFEMLSASDRNAYTNFMRELYTKLHPMGYMVTMAVPAKTFDSSKAYWTYAYDYKSLASYTDQVILMTYDEHWQSGTPGPIASNSWVQQVVNYSTSVIPKSKIILGLAAYGYDWNLAGGYAKSYSVQGAYNTAAKYGAEIQWDDTAKVPYFNYTDSTGANRIVYFEDSTSISYKLNIVSSSNIAGVAVWRLGLEDDKYWTTIKEKLK